MNNTLMKAAWLASTQVPAEIRELPRPALTPSGVIVKVLAVRVPSYTAGVFDGSLAYDLPVPLIPGPTCVGQIEAIGEDVFDLTVGDIVLCNSLLSSGDQSNSRDEILIGWTGTRTERSRRMQQQWRDGSFAEYALYPARCLTVLPGAAGFDRKYLPFLASLAIADGGLRRGELEGGQTVIINGATGQLGGAAVLLALARGAGVVIATGRDRQRLATLAALGPRVRVHTLTSDRAQDTKALRDLSNGPVDLVVDYLADTPTADPTLAAMDALRLLGTMVLVGGVRKPLTLAYSDIMRRQLTIRGSFMFDQRSALSTWNLVRSGALDLSQVNAHAFGLTAINEAVTRAKTLGGFDYALLLPHG